MGCKFEVATGSDGSGNSGGSKLAVDTRGTRRRDWSGGGVKGGSLDGGANGSTDGASGD